MVLQKALVLSIAQQCPALLNIYDRKMGKKSLDNKGAAGDLLTELSKAFDCLNHGLLIAKLDAYGLGYPSLNLINSYLTNIDLRELR